MNYESGSILLLITSLVCLTGCGQNQDSREKRPRAGDVITPEILLGKTWKQKGNVLLSARLFVQGEDEDQPQLMQLEDVPYDDVPKVTLTFFTEDKVTETFKDVHLTRDC